MGLVHQQGKASAGLAQPARSDGAQHSTARSVRSRTAAGVLCLALPRRIVGIAPDPMERNSSRPTGLGPVANGTDGWIAIALGN